MFFAISCDDPRMSWSRKRTLGAGLLALGIVSAAVLKPRELPAPRDPYFDGIASEIKAHGLHHSVAILDLDRIDANLAAIRRVLGSDFQLRATTKSLPSYELLEYVLDATSSRRVMEFYGPFLHPLVERLGSVRPIDVLLGKPLPVGDLEQYLSRSQATTQALRPVGSGSVVRFLIDTPERLDAYLEVARRRNVQLDVALELDIGLHRGGAADSDSLLAMVQKIERSEGRLRLGGVMGYDGHVAHAPPLLQSTAAAEQDAFRAAMQNLGHFTRALQERFPKLVQRDFIINGGGSKTYARYRLPDGKAVGPINELALGSAILKPADFDHPMLSSHQPALFIAEPVLKRTSPGRLPFADAIGALWRWWNPNRHDSVFVYGGGWDLTPVYPGGLSSNPFYNDRPADNRIPNQTLLNAGRHHPVQPGDLVFYRPLQSDAIMQFDELLIFRGGRLITTWRPLSHRL